MKCIDKFRQEHPELANMNVDVYKCPHMYGYAPKPQDCEIGHHDVSREMCKACWNREVDADCYSTQVGFDFVKDEIDQSVEEMIHAYVPKKTESTTSVGSPKILDSGNRREFETGAVRDIQEGKGRCDLMPLDVMSDLTNNSVLYHINGFKFNGDTLRLEMALKNFVTNYTDWCGDGNYAKVGFPTMFLEVSKHFEEGAKKYGENNWQKGIPTHCYIDSAVRHYLKYLRGDTDEPHDRAFCWNIICCIWTCIHKPELNDYAKWSEE